MLIFVAIAILIVLYAAICIPLAVIARRTNDQAANAWMAFIPVVNLILMCWIARVSGWAVLIVLLSPIPLLGQLAVLGFQVYLWIRIGRRFNRRILSYVAAVLPLFGGWILALSVKREAPAVLDADAAA